MNSDSISIQSIIKALYEVISGGAGEPRDWDRDRALFYPDARLVRTGIDEGGKPWALSMAVEDYIENVKDHFKKHGFFEYQTDCRIERFGNIAHAFSTYNAKHHPDDAEPFKRGINSIQLYNDGKRWWIINILWDNERPGNPLPSQE